jgi:hypothetical protein
MYEYIISLGNSCKVASGLSRKGYRSFSSPFDWVVSDFKGVLQSIEDGFANYLNEELLNLEDDSKENASYLNSLYNISFQHDFKSNAKLSEQIKNVTKKYDRRINNFFESIKKVTLFIRYISNDDELNWIQENYCNILNVLKKWNPKNHIIFISNRKIENPVFDMYIVSQIKENDGEYGFFFDENKQLQEYLDSNYSKDKKSWNLYFYAQKIIDNEISLKNVVRRVSCNYSLTLKLLRLKQRGYSLGELFNKKEFRHIAIYGIGEIGKLLYEELFDSGISIEYFIDMYSNKTNIFGIDVLNDNFNLAKIDTIIVTIVSEFYDIKRSLNSRGNCKVISLDDIVSEFLEDNVFDKN